MDTLHALIIVSVPILVPIAFFLILFLVLSVRKIMRAGKKGKEK